jgi:nicotinamide-nucleotide amidase
MLASTIIDVPGASQVFYEGIVAYADDAKIDRLNVEPTTINEYTAVSAETCAEMCNNVSDVDRRILGLSSTGIAGPGGVSQTTPKGLVFLGISSEFGIKLFRNVFTGDRATIRQKATVFALFVAIKHIEQYFS